MPTLIVKVDLSSPRRHKTIRNNLEKYKDRWDIEKIEYDEKKGDVKLCGPFDPEELTKRLCEKACKIIEKISVPEPCAPPPCAPPPCPPTPESPKPCPPILELPKPWPPKPESPKPCPPKPESPKPCPPKPCPPEPPCWYPYPCPYPYPYPCPYRYPYPCPYPYPYPFPCECPPYWGICPENNKPQGWCTSGCESSAWCDGGYGPPPPHPPCGRPMCRLVCEEEGGYCSIM